MKALTLTQPWASLVAMDLKKVETRSWYTSYRGLIAIHAAKGFPKYAREFTDREREFVHLPERLPAGAVIATARLVKVVRTEEAYYEISAMERRYGDYAPGRWAWFLEDIVRVNPPFFCKGALSLWEWKR